MAPSARLQAARFSGLRDRLLRPLRGRAGWMRAGALLAIAGAFATTLRLTGSDSSAGAAAMFGGDTVVVFGPKSFAGSGGNGTTYVERFTPTVVPGTAYTLRIDNGNPNGTNRSAKVTVLLNGFEVVSQTEVTQAVARLDKLVALTPVDTLRITVATANSTVKVTVFGTPDPTYTVYGPRDFTIASGSGFDSTKTFTASFPSAPRLYVFNGATNGSRRVTSGTITVNGTSIALTSGIGSASKAVSLFNAPTLNTLRVVVNGPTNAFVTVRITSADTVRPVVTMTAPLEDALAGGTVQVQGTARDNQAVANVRYAVTVNVLNPPRIELVDSGTTTVAADSTYSVVVHLKPGATNNISVTAVDRAGNSSPAVARSVTSDTVRPALVLTAPTDGLITRNATVTVAGTATDASGVTVNVNGMPLAVQPGGAFSGDVALVEGVNVLTVTAVDGAGNSLSQARTVTRDATPPLLSVTSPEEGATTSEASIAVTGTVTDATALALTINGTGTTIGAGGAFEGTVALAEGPNTLTVLATDAAGNTATVVRHVTRSSVSLPPDPSTVAPPIDSAVATTVFDATQFLYTGANPIQTGVAPGTIEVPRAVLIRGVVRSRADDPIGGVTVDVQGRAEFGQTLTRADGRFDLVVNGGDQLTLRYRKAGYLEAQRTLPLEWNETISAPDVVLLQLDPQVTTVDFSDPVEVARGSTVTDADGTRRATLMFEQGTTATMHLPDGSVDTLPALDIRATEFTVGATGRDAMPGTLPPASAYTYAVELTADQALASGATEVMFDRPVAFYVENFIGFPVGIHVPVGYYDRQAAVWRPLPDGRVIKILDVTGGVASIDVSGSGSPASSAALDSLGITSAELTRLGALYASGQTLWRSQHTHFSIVDWNWAGGPPLDALAPLLREPFRRPSECPGHAAGSIIECENQVLGEQIGIAGTPFSLAYRSSRVPGFVVPHERMIPLSGPSIPASLKRIDLKIDVGGRLFTDSFPAQPNQRHRFVWDGKDGYGRRLQGAQPFTARIGYVYNAIFQYPGSNVSSFGVTSGLPVTVSRLRGEYTYWQELHGSIGGMDAYRAGIGAWTLSPHHFYDPASHMLYTGDGRQRGVDQIASTIWTIGGTTPGYGGDGGPATSAKLNFPADVAVAPDGTLYIADFGNTRVRRITPDGIITTIAGGGTSLDDSIPATDADLGGDVTDVALDQDGNVYMVVGYSVIRKVDSTGMISTMAGTWDQADTTDGDGKPAIEVSMAPFSIAVGPDNSLYILDEGYCYIRQVTPDGINHNIAGTGVCGFSGDGGPAKQAQVATWYGIAVGPDGSVYFPDGFTRVRRIGPDGIISTIAGDDQSVSSGDGGPATAAQFECVVDVAAPPDGSVLTADECTSQVRRIAPDGIIRTVAGRRPKIGLLGDGGPAMSAEFRELVSVDVKPNGHLIITDDVRSTLREMQPVMPELSSDRILVASEDGGELYEFTTTGEHVRTRNALTGATLDTFVYNPSGSLHSVTEAAGTTTIERDGQDHPTAIVAPHGQRTTIGLNAAGYLASVSNPAGEVVRVFHGSTGLLDSLYDPRSKPHRFEYDSVGRLTRDRDGAGGDQTLVRTETDTGYTVVRSTALGRQTTYSYEQLPTGARRSTRVDQSGLSMVTIIGVDESTQLTSPDATLTTVEPRGDPRWGIQASAARTATMRVPSGLTASLRTASAATLSTSDDPLSLVTLTDSVVLNNKATVSVYNAAQRRLTTTTPEGRQRIIRTDSSSRVLSARSVGLDSTSYLYDAHGRLSQVLSGGRAWSYSYDGLGRVLSTLDPLGRRDSLFYDAADRLARRVLPGGREVRFAYDSTGNLTSITPPGRPAHAYAHNAVDQDTSYTPPNVGLTTPGTRYSYNADRQLTQITRPDSVAIAFGYESTTGRLSTITFDRGQVALGYSAGTGQLSSITAPGSTTLSFTYDGVLPKTVTWGGAVSGSVGVGYNTDFRITSQAVNGANSATFAYDRDGLLTSAGALGIKRNAQHGLVERDSLNMVKSIWSYTSRGAVTSYTATSGATTLFQTSYTRDSVDRITSLNETIAGTTSTSTFTYDSAGRLFEVRRDGVLTATYEYDGNGNRTRLTTPGGVVTGTYDNQDRLTSYGTTTYTYGSNGELKSKTEPGVGTTTYRYDALGNLVEATLPDGTALTYVIDGQNRRIGKKVNGVLVQGFLYQSQLAPVAELDGSNQVVSRFVYGTRANVPDYIVKGGVTYRILADHLGSVRLVVNAATGAIAQRVDYDEYGRVTQNTAPGFQPFGYAGGLLDNHTGLTRFGARDYHAAAGRWTAKDPVGFAGGDANVYSYVFNDPINSLDLTGLTPFGPCETAKLLDRVRRNAADNPFDFWRDHTGSERFDFKAIDLADNGVLDDYYSVEGQSLRSDEFGNYAAGYAGVYGFYGMGMIGYVGMRAGGIYYDWKDNGQDRGNPEWDWDMDSAPAINAGANRAWRETQPTSGMDANYGVSQPPPAPLGAGCDCK